MFSSHLKTAFRSLLNHKYVTFINLAGLVVGMTAALLIWQYIAFEKSYDVFQTDADRIVRVRTDRSTGGRVNMQFAAGAACAGPVLKENFPEVEDYLKVYPISEKVFSYGDVNFREKKVAYAGQNFFQFFSYPLLQGDSKTCLAEPWTACISEKVAKKFFGHVDPMGKTIQVNGQRSCKITGLFQDMPENTHLKFDILLSYITFAKVLVPDNNPETQHSWDGFLTYLRLKPGTDQAALQAKFAGLIDSKYGENLKSFNEGMAFILQPLLDIHLTSHYLFEIEPNGDANAVRFLLIIGSLVLFIAWFNYINLATARSETRAREVGVRKAIGSGRRSLIWQFLTEASLLNLIAIICSFALSQALLPAFGRLVGKSIPFTLASNPALWATMLGVFLGGTFLAGLYPSFVLSAFQPINILKGNARGHGASGSWLRKGLVVGQFTASIALMVSTIVIFKQIEHLRAAKLGVNIEQTLVVKSPSAVDSTYQQKFQAFKQEIGQIAAVSSLTGSSATPGSPFDWTAGGIRRWGAPESEAQGVQAMAVDFDFVPSYGLEVVAGRAMSAAIRSDSNACMLNEKAVAHLRLGTPAEAVNTEINFWGDRLKIVGIVKDFHQQSPKEAFDPLVIRLLDAGRPPKFFSLKLHTGQLPQTLDAIQTKWAAIFPGNPFDYFFLDDHFDRQYAADRRFGQVFGLFAILAIFVSCLGLFALAAFVAERRKKEIGVRKVLGATVENLVGLLSKDFLTLVGVAIAIASPLAWWAMRKWLADFAYHIEMQWWMFVGTGLAAILIAFLTVGFQSVKAALANPVKSLRSE